MFTHLVFKRVGARVFGQVAVLNPEETTTQWWTWMQDLIYKPRSISESLLEIHETSQAPQRPAIFPTYYTQGDGTSDRPIVINPDTLPYGFSGQNLCFNCQHWGHISKLGQLTCAYPRTPRYVAPVFQTGEKPNKLK